MVWVNVIILHWFFFVLFEKSPKSYINVVIWCWDREDWGGKIFDTPKFLWNWIFSRVNFTSQFHEFFKNLFCQFQHFMLETNPMNNRDTLFCGSEPLLDVWIAFEFHKMGIWFLELAEWILGVKYYRVSHMDNGIKFERRGHIIFFFVNFNYYNFIYNDYF